MGNLMRQKRFTVGLAVALLISTGALAGCGSTASSPTPSGTNAPCQPGSAKDGSQPFREPVKLSSQNGVLNVEMTIKQSEVCLDTVGKPVSNFMTFSYHAVQGTSSNGELSGDNQYPGPTLNVNPGETLVFKLDNALQDLTIGDFYNPAFTPAGQSVPLYPPALTSAPYNNHTHGLHVSPSGNSDNVLLNIPAGQSNTYTYQVPKNQPQGLYWYHGHRHQLTSQETYLGLSGLIAIGRVDGDIPLVTKNDIPVRTMDLQYNYVYDRAGGLAQLNNPNWQQYLSTLTPPQPGQLEDGTYEPKMTPINFQDSAEGTNFFTPWYTGPLSVNNQRGLYQFVPSNLQNFQSTNGGTNVAANPNLPDAQRDVQFTVNGQFQPQVSSRPGQTEIWALANTSDMAFMRVQLTETATGNHPKINIVAHDGNPSPLVHTPPNNDGTTMLIPPGNRFAIAVTMPQTGDLILEMPTDASIPAVSTDQQVNFEYPGVLYTNNGTPNPPAQLGTITVDPANLSFWDGFFMFPTQVLAKAVPQGPAVATTAFTSGQPTDAYTSFVDLAGVKPDVKRSMVIRGDFLNKNASSSDPKAFVYALDNQAFDYVPLIQPRLNSVEEWKWINGNNDQHPMHVHINDFQVMETFNPTGNTANPIKTGVQNWGQDVVNVPAPIGFPQEKKGYVPATTTIRTKFKDYTGTYVMHCHRLNHEDNGLMAIVNVIPEVSSYAVADKSGASTQVRVLNGAGDKPIATVTPFPGYQGDVSLAMADVDGDQILDVVVGAGKGSAPWVTAYSGAATDGKPFSKEIARFLAFDQSFTGGVSVSGADIDGNAMRENIVVGSGPGMASQVKVFSSTLPESPGAAPEVYSSFSPYEADQRGVSVTTGLVDGMSGRQSIVTAPGPGGQSTVKVFRYDLFTPNSADGTPAGMSDMPGIVKEGPGQPAMISSFEAFDSSYSGGVSLATGWVGGAQGGVQRILVGQAAGAGEVRVFSSGSALNGEPMLYLDSPDDPNMAVTFQQGASLRPFPKAGGVSIATTSTTTGADLLVSGEAGSGSVVKKFTFAQPAPKAPSWVAKKTQTTVRVPNSGSATLAGR